MASGWFRGLSPGKILIIGVGWFVVGFGTCTGLFSFSSATWLHSGFPLMLGASGCVALPVSVVAAILVTIFRRAPAKERPRD